MLRRFASRVLSHSPPIREKDKNRSSSMRCAVDSKSIPTNVAPRRRSFFFSSSFFLSLPPLFSFLFFFLKTPRVLQYPLLC